MFHDARHVFIPNRDPTLRSPRWLGGKFAENIGHSVDYGALQSPGGVELGRHDFAVDGQTVLTLQNAHIDQHANYLALLALCQEIRVGEVGGRGLFVFQAGTVNGGGCAVRVVRRD